MNKLSKKNKEPDFKKLFAKLRNQNRRKLDELFHEVHDEVFEKTDCLSCANCCKTTGPHLITKDIDRLAQRMKMRPADFMEKYVRTDEDGDFVLKTLPCPFLGSDNFCLVYSDRPKACREYPHTNRVNMYQLLTLTEKNAEVCPAVVQMLEKLKTDLVK